MRTKKRWVVRLTSVLAAITVLGAIVVAITRQSPKVVTLNSGQTVELLAVVSPGQTYTMERPWHRWGRRFLPQKLQGWIPPRTSSLPWHSTNELSVVLLWTDSSKTVDWPIVVRGVRAEAEDGFLYPESASRYTRPARSGSKNSLFTLLQLESFPRRQSRFRLHFISGMGVSLGSIMVPNPLPRTFGHWEPEPMPIRRTNGPVVLTLESMSVFGRSPDYGDLVVKWTKTISDPRWESYGSIEEELEDITGDKSPSRGGSVGLRLSPAESAWKLTARMARNRLEDFAPDERIVLTNIIIPARDTFRPIDSPTTPDGRELVRGFVGAPGRIGLADVLAKLPSLSPVVNGEYVSPVPSAIGTKAWTSTMPFVRLDLENVSVHEKVWVRSIDSEGRASLIQNVLPIWVGSPVSHYVFEGRITLEDGATLQSIEITISRALEFVFYVDPKEVVPAAKSGP